MSKVLPVTVFSGFLGAGKTTLIANLIKQLPEQRFLVIVNEFGQVSIDDQLLVSSFCKDNYEIRKLSGGLIGYREGRAQFEKELTELIRESDRFDYVLIETSGLASPSSVAEILQSSPFAENFRLDSSLVVVDTPLLLAGKFSHRADAESETIRELFDTQLEFSDVVALNKIDQFDKSQISETAESVRKIAPSVRFIEMAVQGRLEPRLCLDLRLNQPVFDGADSGIDSADSMDGHSHTGLGPHVHGVRTHEHLHEHDPGWLSFVLSSSQPIDESNLIEAVRSIASGGSVLRIKGFFNSPSGVRCSLQAVRDRIRVERIDGKSVVNGRADNHLVVIGYHVKRSQVLSRLSDMTGTRWI